MLSFLIIQNLIIQHHDEITFVPDCGRLDLLSTVDYRVEYFLRPTFTTDYIPFVWFILAPLVVIDYCMYPEKMLKCWYKVKNG